jgi:hypothetical protein
MLQSVARWRPCWYSPEELVLEHVNRLSLAYEVASGPGCVMLEHIRLPVPARKALTAGIRIGFLAVTSVHDQHTVVRGHALGALS